MSLEHRPELSIIVPLLNEAEELTFLFASLSEQRGLSFELILCDGGFIDEQQRQALQLASDYRLETLYIKAPRGRGRQMNAGAAIARSGLLLFLHADSRFSDPDALSRSVLFFRKQSLEIDKMIAAHFSLCFRRAGNSSSLAYFFYEAKTHLNRVDCIRGDQGLMASNVLFKKIGGFDESLPFLEDIKFVEAVAAHGQWLLLPASVSTSARRFETEGLCERQVVNAVIVNAIVTGWDELFTALPGLYRCHPESGRLRLFPLFEGIRKLLACKSAEWRKRFWLATGQHVASNIWQLFFWLDARSAYVSAQSAGQTGNRWTGLYSRHLKSVCESHLFACLTAVAVWLWFRALLLTKKHS